VHINRALPSAANALGAGDLVPAPRVLLFDVSINRGRVVVAFCTRQRWSATPTFVVMPGANAKAQADAPSPELVEEDGKRYASLHAVSGCMTTLDRSVPLQDAADDGRGDGVRAPELELCGIATPLSASETTKSAYLLERL
jgi:hypothetical protein